MFSKIDRWFIGAKNRISAFAEEFRSDENGVSNIVATVILILIVVLLAAFFWKQLSEWFKQLWEKITTNSDTIQPLS